MHVRDDREPRSDLPDPSSPGSPPLSATCWHAQPVPDVVAQLDTDVAHGLADAQAEQRLQRVGPNRLPQAQARPGWLRWLQQFHNPLIYVLMAAGAATLALGDVVDTVVIALVVLVNAIIGFVQEGKAESALDAVRHALAEQATVWRDGQLQRRASADLVPGDLVQLEAGDKVPADLRLTHVHQLMVVEAALTGESVAVAKQQAPVAADAALADRACMAYAGTLVARGAARGVVVATGVQTEVGRIGAMLGQMSALRTPLTRRLDRLAIQTAWAVLVVSVITLLIGWLGRHMPLPEIFLAVIGLAVAAIPEGLPAVVTVILAIGTRQMAHRGALIRRLPAVETLGNVDLICTDKTGTLTCNEMTVQRVITADGCWQVEGVGLSMHGGFVPPHATGNSASPAAAQPDGWPQVEALLRAAALCNDARLERAQQRSGDAAPQAVGDPMEVALLIAAAKAGLDQAMLGAAWPRLDVIPFDADSRWMATMHHDPQGQVWVVFKGAPEVVLQRCYGNDAVASELQQAWLQQMQQAAAQGLRVLAVAARVEPAVQAQPTLQHVDLSQGFQMLGLLALMDPPRPEAQQAVADCLRAGLQVKMITGDHGVTAAAIGRSMGLRTEPVLHGHQIDQASDAELALQLQTTDVIARASPEHKLRLVHVLQAQQHLVAMTGDGVNDAPALRAADIGVAMGRKGTDAAREASDLVLTDDNFATIAVAVHQGRVVYDNIKKTLGFMLPTNGAQAAVIVLAVVLGVPLPVTPAQVLWINTVTAVTLALALAFEPAEPGVMLQRPRPSSEPLLTRPLLLRIAFVAAALVGVSFAAFEAALIAGHSLPVARTSAVNMLVIGEAVYLLHARFFTMSAFKSNLLTGNPAVLPVLVLLALLQIMLTYVPALQHLFGTAALPADLWAVLAGLGLLLFVVIELEKAGLRRLGHRRM